MEGQIVSKRVALYLRVSTSEQTTSNQRLELERWASIRGFTIVKVYEDAGISGAKGRDQRPQFDAMLKGAARREYDVVAAWDVSRLGRSMRHLVTTLDELRATGCDLYLHTSGLDTSTPSGEALFGMLAVFSQLERSMNIERVHAGLARARAQGTRSGRPLGRPGLTPVVREAARAALLSGASVRQAQRASGASVGSISGMRKELILAGQLAAA